VDLNETLRAAVAEPPPTSIDLDVLIKHERRRERRQQWLTGGGLAAGVAAVVGVTAVGFAGSIPVPFAGGGAPPCPVVSPDPIDLKKRLASEAPYASGKPDVPTPDGSHRSPDGGPPTIDPTRSAGPTTGPTALARPTTGPTGPTGPAPTESCGVAARRFNSALAGALHRVAPAAKLTNGDDARRTAVWFQQYGDASYNASIVMKDGDRRNGLFVGIGSYGRAPTREQACGKVKDSEGCSYETRPDGTVVTVVRVAAIQEAYQEMTEGTPARAHSFAVQVYRPDGTLVSAAVKPWTDEAVPSGPVIKTRGVEPVITPEQVVTIALTPELTLFP
jgi:hypothetical protein